MTDAACTFIEPGSDPALLHGRPRALVIGNLDGVHLGHRDLIQRAVRTAAERDLVPTALTFDPHPTKVIAPTKAPRLLNTVSQRCQLLRNAGLEEVLVMRFDRQLSLLPAERFLSEILVDRLRAEHIVIGRNFRFGHKAAGDVSMLQSMAASKDFTVDAAPLFRVRGIDVSSSEIRTRIEAGQAASAARLLGRAFSLSGDVVSGQGIGRKQTVPTLNLRPEGEVIPARGVYVTRCRNLNGQAIWPSVTNIGYRPTFEGEGLTIETFLLGPLVEEPARIEVQFLHYLRPEKKFDDPPALKAQILRDVSRAHACHRRALRWQPEAFTVFQSVFTG
jgi:riboflavin kinase/FMN adenylyltransferase